MQLLTRRSVLEARDPYVRMAYSYVPVNGVGWRSQLAQPVDRALFFAEATQEILSTHASRAI
ncbi:MAG: hypothetical protein ACFB0D_11735 [Phormidesmis sp.]